MAPVELIDSRVKVEQCQLAIKALHGYQAKKDAELAESELLPGKEQTIWLNVAVKKISAEKKLMPVKIPIVHPLIDPRTAGVCLITKDPQRDYKDLLEDKGIKFVSRVIGISKLKGKFKPFEARRLLLKEHGLFLADDRVIPLLPKLLGEKWFQAKKQPIPVTLTRKDLKKELEYAISSTYMNQNRGTNTAIKIGTMTQTPEQVLANLKTALPVIAQRIKGGWDNIQALTLKTNTSVALPVWNCSLDDKEVGRFALEKAAGDAEPAKKRKREEEEKKAAAKVQAVDETPKKKKKTDEAAPAAKKDKSAKKAPVSEPAPMVVDEPIAAASTSKEKAAKKDKSTKKTSVPEPAPIVVDEPVAATSPSKEKKKKGKKADAAPTDEPMNVDKPAPSKKEKVKDSVDVATTADVQKESGKTKSTKRKSLAVDAPAPVAEEVPETKKTGKKAQKHAIESPEKTDAKSQEAAETPVKSVEGKKKKKDKTSDSPTKPTPAKSDLADIATESPVVPGKKEKKKDKKKGAEPAEAAVVADDGAVTAEEMKQKKSGAPGEKKKEKVAKSKTGKGAKESLLGKKGLTR